MTIGIGKLNAEDFVYDVSDNGRSEALRGRNPL